jgi:D-lactate dehydrogenase (cytochrome)
VLPKTTSVAVATFPTVHDAANCVGKVVGEGIQVAGVEILDDTQMRCINESGTTSRKWTVAPTLFFKFAGTPAGVKEQIAIVQKFAKSTNGKTFEFAKNNDEATELWSARKEALWSVMAMRRDDGDHVWTTDVVSSENSNLSISSGLTLLVGCTNEPTTRHYPANKRRHQPGRSSLRHGRTRWRWQLPL